MSRFSTVINLNPKIVPELSPEQKRDCVSEIQRRAKHALVYSIIFGAAVMIFIIVYAIISMAYMLRYRSLLDTFDIMLLPSAVVILLMSFFSYMMNSKCIVITFLLYLLAAAYFTVTGGGVQIWVIPLAIVGVVMYFRLYRVCDLHEALIKEEGYPDFVDLTEMKSSPAVQAILNPAPKEDNSLSVLTEMAIAAHKNNSNGNSDENEKQNDRSKCE